MIAKANGPPTTISAIGDKEGKIIRATPEIVKEFKDYYEKSVHYPTNKCRGGNVGVF